MTAPQGREAASQARAKKGAASARRRRRAQTAMHVSPDAFHGLMAGRSQRLLGLVRFLASRPLDEQLLTRPLLGSLVAQAAQVKELLDTYGAVHNRRWHAYRQHADALVLFADTGYKLLHLRHSMGNYHLLPVEGDFPAATEEGLRFVANVLMLVSARMTEEAERLELPLPRRDPGAGEFAERLPQGFLPRDRRSRHVTSAEETVAHLATAFLNLAAEGEFLHTPGKVCAEEYPACVPEPVGEERVWLLAQRFHNLQNLYDTYVSDTDTEDQDPDLKVLRGHVSVIFHLLEVATSLVQYYERNVHLRGPETGRVGRPLVQPRALLEAAMQYAVAFASRYLLTARSLCQEMLKRYAQVGRVSVPVPRYRGFHVRPSTLVARIAQHYGSEVRMELDGDAYDAGSPLELFRANEKINAAKRHQLVEAILQAQNEVPAHLAGDLGGALRWILLHLAHAGKVIVYDQPLPLEELDLDPGASLSEVAPQAVARLLALGKIDMDCALTATFVGDKRVLEDLRLLAEHGYGEDAFGNNVPLPEKLRYLRR